jgi:hypothetical protein
MMKINIVIMAVLLEAGKTAHQGRDNQGWQFDRSPMG